MTYLIRHITGWYTLLSSDGKRMHSYRFSTLIPDHMADVWDECHVEGEYNQKLYLKEILVPKEYFC